MTFPVRISASGLAGFPVAGFAAQMHDRPDRDEVRRDGVVNPKRKSVDKIASDIFFDNAPCVGIAPNHMEGMLDLLDK